MANNKTHNDSTMSEETAQNAGARTAAINADPGISLEEARNAAAGESPDASGSVAPSTIEGNVPSTNDPYPTNIPSTDHPLPDDVGDPEPVPHGTNQTESGETDQYAH